MTSKLLIAYPDIQANALEMTSGHTYAEDTHARNANWGMRPALAQLETAIAQAHYVQYDLGTGITQAANHLIIARGDILKTQGVTEVALKQCAAPYVKTADIAGLTLWLDAGRGYTVAGGKYTVLADQAGVCANFTGAATQQPAWTNPDTTGRPAIAWDGSNDVLLSISTLSTLVSNNAFTVWAVITTASDVTTWQSILTDGAVNSYFRLYISAGKIGIGVYDGGFKMAVADVSASTTYVVRARFTAGQLGIRVNGGAEGTQAAGNIPTLTGALRYGASNTAGADPFKGTSKVIIVSNQYISSADIETFLTAEYKTAAAGITTDYQAETLVGPKSNDYLKTFTTTAAARYWWLEFDSYTTAADSKYGRSKNYIGSWFDIGKDPANFRYSTIEDNTGELAFPTGGVRMTKIAEPRYRFEVDWAGITDANAQTFAEKVLADPTRKYVFLYATNIEILGGQTLVHCKCITEECGIKKTNKKDYALIHGVFEQVVG